MASFLQVLLDSFQFLWPLRKVDQAERGGYYVCGRFWREVGPGIWPVIPWFIDVKAYSSVPAILSTPRLDITLTDGSTLSFIASATMQMLDFNLTINTVESYTETMQELLSAVIADKLASMDRQRLGPEGRGRVLSDLCRWVNAESMVFGIRTSKVRFNTFVLNIRTYRLLQESTPATW